jgi:regulator of protease activity HflC (stomatin/prohibitin superfamily)
MFGGVIYFTIFANTNIKPMKKLILSAALLVALFSTSGCYDFYRTQNELDAQSNGKAILLKAESSKKALIEQAKAENEAATLQAESRIKIAKAESQAEIERAYGVAKANEIIGQSLKGNTEYLRYLMIQSLGNSKGERIYIPTEAGLPILEAK